MKKVFYILSVMLATTLLSAQSNEKWNLVFEENFNGSKINTEHWSYCPRQNPDWAKYLISNDKRTVDVKNGNLILKAIKNPDTSTDNAPYLTGGINTRNKVDIAYGKVEVCAKFNKGQGAWPAIWMMPTDGSLGWPKAGEIDIMEHINSETRIYQTIHSYYADNSPYGLAQKYPKVHNNATFNQIGYNIYGIEWYPDRIDFTVNGTITFSYPRFQTDVEWQWPFDKDFNLILNQAAGGSWTGAVAENALPFEMKIDWVKMYTLSTDREYDIPKWKGSLHPNSTKWQHGFVKKITSDHSSVPFEYTATKRPSGHQLTIQDTLVVDENSTFSLNFEANSLGSYNETKVLEDLRYTCAYIYTDFKGNKELKFNSPQIGDIPPKHNIGGNTEVLNFQRTFTTPQVTNDRIGRIRIVYHKAWEKREFIKQSVNEGIAYDIIVKIKNKSTAINNTYDYPIQINKNDRNITIKNLMGKNSIQLYNITGQLIYTSQTSESNILIPYQNQEQFSILKISNKEGQQKIVKI